MRKKLSAISKKKKTDVRSLWKLGVALAIMLAAGFIFQVNEMIRETYEIQEYNREIARVLEESRRKEYSFLRANSLARVEGMIEELNFESVGNIQYIQVADTQVAAR